MSAAALAAIEWAGSPWVVLEVPETVPGRELEKTLQNAGIASVSAFSVPVLFNDFDRIREIPLDSYNNYVETLDPRNDSYIRGLRSFFMAEGKCRFFLRQGFGLRRKLEKLLPEFSASWALESSGAFPVTACAVFAVAALAFVLLEAGKRVTGTRPPARRFSGNGEPPFPPGALCAVPALFPLALTGAPGLAASGLFVLLFHSLKPVAREYFRHYRKSFRPMTGNECRELAGLYPFHCAAALSVFPCYILCCLAGGISPVIALPAPFFFCASLFLSHKAEASVDRNAFFPLPIGGKVRLRALFPPALPVFLAAFAVAAFTAGQPASAPFPRSASYGPLPGPEAYAVHAEFQTSFSRRSLYGESNYGSYPLGEDGLISGFVPAPPLPFSPLPPYPPELEELRASRRRYLTESNESTSKHKQP
ncbi:MAG: hypothetical protein LBP29_07805 [Treponema sp.]|nr:hypothetical protein [Treponema sp.]